MHRYIILLSILQAVCAKQLPFPLEPLGPFAITYDSVKNQECKAHSLKYLEELKNLKMWALQMYDSSGKIPYGVLRGNAASMGDDVECLNAFSGDENSIRGKFCLGTIYTEPKEDQDNPTIIEIYEMIHSRNPLRSDPEEGIGFFASFSQIYLGMCVPDSCTAEDFSTALMEWANPGNVSDSLGVNLRITVASDDCITEPARMHTKGKMVIFLYVFMTLLGIAGSFYSTEKITEKVKKGGILKKIFFAFSFRRNLSLLFDTSTPMDELGCLHGVRAIFCANLYILHKLIVFLNNAIANREDIRPFAEGGISMSMRAFWSQVDTFVVMSGLLTSYYATKKLQEGKRLNILKMYFQRYIKFTPLFCICVLWLENLAEHMFYGPMYLRFGKKYVQTCQNQWLHILTYTNTYGGSDNMCFPPSHQLETDMQMYLLAPFLVLFLWKKPKIAVPSIVCLGAFLTLLKYRMIMSERLATIIFHGIKTKLFSKSADYLYMNVLHRLVPYFAGIVLGYYLRVRDKRWKLPKIILLAGSAFSIYCLHYVFVRMVHAARPGYVYDAEEAAEYGCWQPILWSFAFCWFVYICANGHAEWINRPLRWKGFLVSSRLSFAFYLCQLAVMVSEVSQTPTPIMFSPSLMFDLNTLAKVIVITIWLTLLFLFPIGHLMEIITGTQEKVMTTTRREKGR